MTQLLGTVSAAEQPRADTSCWGVTAGWRANETSANKLFCLRSTNLDMLVNILAFKVIPLSLRSMKHLDWGLSQSPDFKNDPRGPFNCTPSYKSQLGKMRLRYQSQNHVFGCIWWPSKLLKQTLAVLPLGLSCNTIQSSSQD